MKNNNCLCAGNRPCYFCTTATPNIESDSIMRIQENITKVVKFQAQCPVCVLWITVEDSEESATFELENHMKAMHQD